MADATYDAVVIGGGKGLVTAMYLAKYGGMSVAVFERRQEVGGAWANEESPAPGFLANIHATLNIAHYWLPLIRDFPGFEERGANFDQYLCCQGQIFSEDDSCLTVYSQKYDPTQERTAKEIARFSERDAELWLRMWKLEEKIWPAMLQDLFNPPAPFGTLGAIQQMVFFDPDIAALGVEPRHAMSSVFEVLRDMFESPELRSVIMRQTQSGGTDPGQPGLGLQLGVLPAMLPRMGFNRGGMHAVAHAMQRTLLEHGGKVFTQCEVDRVLIENGTAKGIRLTDGSEIEARKVVVSNLSPYQLCFQLIGPEHLDSRILRKVENIQTSYIAISWYSWALHQAPKYKAASFNPDVNEVVWLALGNKDDETLVREAHWRRLGKMAPELNLVVWCHSLVDPTQAPPGKHVAGTENFVLPANALTEREWMQFKKQHAQDVMNVWGQYAPNMTWDNVIGYAAETPYDCCRLKNMAPTGNWAVIDHVPRQMASFRPIPELSNYRTPIKNLYPTGSAWHPTGIAHCCQGYITYKAIAEDLGLDKPWLEPGKEEPDSLVEVSAEKMRRLQQATKAAVK